MGVDNIFLSLIPLIIAVVIGMMIGWEIGIAGGSLAGLVVLFVEASKPNATPLYGVAGILLTVVFFATAGDSLRRILIREKFKQRIAQHITDGTVLYRDKLAYKTGDEYERVANDWVNKVASDIHEHRGQSDADQFLAEYPKKQSVSMESEDTQRNRIQNMLSSYIGWLQWLQQRL